jgi:hypothetical protein
MANFVEIFNEGKYGAIENGYIECLKYAHENGSFVE